MTRHRRSAANARRQILEAAEKQLTERGAEGVRIQDIAQELGVVPATVLHHFGSREALLGELVLHGARKLEGLLSDLIAAARPNLRRLTSELYELYECRGYAALFAPLAGELEYSTESPAFAPLLESLRDMRDLTTRKQRERAAHALLALNLTIFADALVGAPMRAAVGLPSDDASRARFRRFVGRLMDEVVSAE